MRPPCLLRPPRHPPPESNRALRVRTATVSPTASAGVLVSESARRVPPPRPPAPKAGALLTELRAGGWRGICTPNDPRGSPRLQRGWHTHARPSVETPTGTAPVRPVLQTGAPHLRSASTKAVGEAGIAPAIDRLSSDCSAAELRTQTSGTRGIRTLIAGVQDRSLPVGRWSRDEADGGIPRCRTGTSWVSSRRADRYARIPSRSARDATARRRSDLAGCQRSPRPEGQTSSAPRGMAGS